LFLLPACRDGVGMRAKMGNRAYYHLFKRDLLPCSGGFVPGWDYGGAAVSPQADGVFSGLDRICEVLFRVLVVIVRRMLVISFYLLNFSLICSYLIENISKKLNL
jgi:hypothetical protein